MNNLTHSAVIAAEQDIRNARRLDDWAARWEARFGRPPCSAAAGSRRLLAEASGKRRNKKRRISAEILVHPVVFRGR